MPAPTIIRGSEHMFSTTYEGNGGGQRVGKFIPFTDNGTIAKSCIFNRADTAKLDRTPGSAGSRRIFTLSAWLKFAVAGSGGTGQFFFNSAISTNEQTYIGLDASYRLNISTNNSSGAAKMTVTTNRTLEDTSKFYHIVVAFDTTQGTDSNKIKVYIDGTQETSFNATDYSGGDNYDLPINVDSANLRLGLLGPNSNYYFDGNMAEVNFIDGTAYGPDTFGITDTSTGRWIPKSLGSITYGTNGFRLQFANSAGQTIGDDTSGNGNDLTVTSLVASDIVTDSPTQNHITLDENIKGPNISLSEGNLKATYSGGAQSYGIATSTPVFSGKWYCECTVNTRGDQLMFVNVWNQGEYQANKGNDNPVFKVGGVGYRDDTGDIDSDVLGGVNIDYGASYTSNDIIGVALDADTGTVWYSKNGTWQNNASSAQIANGLTANSAVTGLNAVNNNKGFLFGTTAHTNHVSTWNFGQKAFEYTPPTGYEAVQQDNFATRDEGIPGMVWVKNRDTTDYHTIYDSSRGVSKEIYPNDTSAEASAVADGLKKFLKGGYATEDAVNLNTIGESFVAWNWVANGGTAVANTDGSGATLASTTQANQTAGFSIVTYTGNGTQGAKVAHGLSQAPEWILIKVLTNHNWQVYHTSVGAEKSLQLDVNDAPTDNAGYYNDASPTSSVFSVGANTYRTNDSSSSHVAYCWHSVEGYSKFGLYKGNGNANGPNIFTGFKPSWIMIKRTDSSTGGNWSIIDNARYPANPIGTPLLADTTDAESGLSATTMDFLSNGFKIRNTLNSCNNSSGTYIFMAFAEHPFLGDGTNPATAR